MTLAYLICQIQIPVSVLIFVALSAFPVPFSPSEQISQRHVAFFPREHATATTVDL